MRLAATLALVVVLSLVTAPARAIEATVFASDATPRETWDLGAGAEATFGILKFFGWSAELARQPNPLEAPLTTLTVSAFVSMPLGKFRLYGGVGAGLSRQAEGDAFEGDTGTHRVLVVGLKRTFSEVLLLKAEYRRFDLGDDAPMALRHRFSLGAGLSL